MRSARMTEARPRQHRSTICDSSSCMAHKGQATGQRVEPASHLVVVDEVGVVEREGVGVDGVKVGVELLHLLDDGALVRLGQRLQLRVLQEVGEDCGMGMGWSAGAGRLEGEDEAERTNMILAILGAELELVGEQLYIERRWPQEADGFQVRQGVAAESSAADRMDRHNVPTDFPFRSARRDRLLSARWHSCSPPCRRWRPERRIRARKIGITLP